MKIAFTSVRERFPQKSWEKIDYGHKKTKKNKHKAKYAPTQQSLLLYYRNILAKVCTFYSQNLYEIGFDLMRLKKKKLDF